MRDRNLVPRQESRVAMALGAGVRHVLTGNGGVGFAGTLYGVDGTVTGDTLRRVGVTAFRGLTVDAGVERLDFVGVTLHAFPGHQFFGGRQFVDAAVTGRASGVAEGGVSAGRKGFGLVGMARAALDFYDLGGMREFLDVGVAVFATENGVSTG